MTAPTPSITHPAVPPTLAYSQSGLDRMSEKRQDPQWIRERLGQDSTLITPTWRYRHAMMKDEDSNETPRALWVPRPDADALLDASSETIFLGLRGETAMFTVDLNVDEEDQAQNLAGGPFQDLRRVGPLLPEQEAATLAQARGMIYWHRHHRFCSRCGAPTESRHGGYMRQCSSESCGKGTFPRMDPAVIMLVEFRPENGEPLCLLGQGTRWPKGNFSTLAGFMEPGESLEETVVREVLEEAGVPVTDVVYQGSQPWPFPSSLMLGFRARALSLDLKIDPEELGDAQWFTAEQLKTFGNWTDPEAEFRLPRHDSIARYLVDSWLAENS